MATLQIYPGTLQIFCFTRAYLSSFDNGSCYIDSNQNNYCEIFASGGVYLHSFLRSYMKMQLGFMFFCRFAKFFPYSGALSTRNLIQKYFSECPNEFFFFLKELWLLILRKISSPAFAASFQFICWQKNAARKNYVKHIIRCLTKHFFLI